MPNFKTTCFFWPAIAHTAAQRTQLGYFTLRQPAKKNAKKTFETELTKWIPKLNKNKTIPGPFRSAAYGNDWLVFFYVRARWVAS
eukprot:1830891-Amphidinium_carterae.1